MRTRLLVVALVLGCSPKSSGPAAPAAGSQPPVARIGAAVITMAQVDQAAGDKLYEVRSEALNRLIDERILGERAKKAGVSVDKLIESEMKVAPPSEEDIKQVYEQTKASGRQLPPLPEVRNDIVGFLTKRNQDQNRGAYIAKLRQESKVELMLPMPRVQVAAVGPSKGDPKAPITIIEFSDFQCPFCSRAEQVVDQVMAAYPGKIRVVFRDFPLAFHPNAQKAAEGALCAGDQGKYWEMHGKLFANQSALDVPALKTYAKDLGIDGDKFGKCLDGGTKAKEVEASMKAGSDVGVTGTPAFFINGQRLTGAQPIEKFKEIIDRELKSAG